jgi:hypothetical protein
MFEIRYARKGPLGLPSKPTYIGPISAKCRNIEVGFPPSDRYISDIGKLVKDRVISVRYRSDIHLFPLIQLNEFF